MNFLTLLSVQFMAFVNFCAVGVAEIIGVIVEAITTMLGGIGTAIVDFFENLFISGTGETATISVFAIVALAMLGLGFAVSLVYMLIGRIRG